MEEPDDFEENLLSLEDERDVQFSAYFDDIKPYEAQSLLCKIGGVPFATALKRVERTVNGERESLVNEGGRSCCCANLTIINSNQIGMATKFGQTYFIAPGSYAWLGLGVEYHGAIDVDPSVSNIRGNNSRQNAGTMWGWKDITYLKVVESNAAVVQIGKQQLILGPGRYIVRNPAFVVKRVCVADLKQKVVRPVITEQASATGEDVQLSKMMLHGSWEECGAITFVRAHPGYCWVIQNVLGQLRQGIGMTVCRGGERFVDFVNRSYCSRTTRPFRFESKDKQVVRVRVQLEWQVHNAKVWVTRKGAFEDIFDAIEEISESLLRDSVAGMTHEECHAAASSGYDSIERHVKNVLRVEAEELGGILKSFEIRELTFPLLEKDSKKRADEEANFNTKIEEEKRKMRISEQEKKKQDADRQFKWNEQKRTVRHTIEIAAGQARQELLDLAAAASLSVEQQELQLRKEQIRLEARKTTQILSLTQEKSKMESKIRERILAAEGEAERKIRKSRAEANTLLSEAKAKAEAQLALARADAKAAELIGSAYADNDAFLQLELARMGNQIKQARAKHLSDAVRNNKTAMLPTVLQDELTVYNPTTSL